MASVNFIYNEKKTSIHCLTANKMNDICNKYASKIDKSINSLLFLYKGNKINYELTFEEHAQSHDNEKLEMDILVFNIKDPNIINSEIKKIQNNNLHYNIDFQFTLKYHELDIFSCIVLNDGRFATGSRDQSIIIYNNKTFKPDLIIKEHRAGISHLLQLSSGMLASCSSDKTIKIFNIKGNNYEVLQVLNYHNNWVYKLIELSNKKLVSCSSDSSIIFYIEKDGAYIKENQIVTNGECFCVVQTKENEICYHEGTDSSICFYDLNSNKTISKINKISMVNNKCFNMITKDLLLINGAGKLTIVNVNKYKIVRIIQTYSNCSIYVSCLLNENIILTGDSEKEIKQWRIEDDNLKLISTKANTHDKNISVITKLNDGTILSCSYDNGLIKSWRYYY